MAGDPPVRLACSTPLEATLRSRSPRQPPSSTASFGTRTGFGLEGVPVDRERRDFRRPTTRAATSRPSPTTTGGDIVVSVARERDIRITRMRPGPKAPPSPRSPRTQPTERTTSPSVARTTPPRSPVTVTDSQHRRAALEDVEILVDMVIRDGTFQVPLTSGQQSMTDGDGMYTAIVTAQPFNDPTRRP